jgi:hypothetical protein
MKFAALFVLPFLALSCATKDPTPDFAREKVCSKSSIKYLNHPANRRKLRPVNTDLMSVMANTSPGMQICYDDLKARTGRDEFNTCLVVGVNSRGKTEFFDFSSQEITDSKFLECAKQVTRQINYGAYGKNYILVQSYQFFYQ